MSNKKQGKIGISCKSSISPIKKGKIKEELDKNDKNIPRIIDTDSGLTRDAHNLIEQANAEGRCIRVFEENPQTK